MGRVIEPLSSMGASIESQQGRAPLAVQGSRLHGIRYRLPVASAQVKSAILLAGLFAEGETVVEEPVATRDHTERMLRGLGVAVRRVNGSVALRGGASLPPFRLRVPGDFSSAAFFLAAGAVTGGTVIVRNVGVNSTRTGFLTVLERMGVQIHVTDWREEGGEPVATVSTAGRAAAPVQLGADEIPALVDELPLVALLATQANGTSVIRGAGELRVKETDRIAAVVENLVRLGADLHELPDGFIIRGPTPLRGAAVSSRGDHRMAMTLAVAGSIAAGETIVEDAGAAAVSYPDFARDLAQLGGHVLD
jgi:3-phosphoshikimate 1-carboxyvinyltransferase